MIELNGVANIKILLDDLVRNAPNNDEVLIPAAKIYQQLDVLERYMVAIGQYISHGDLKDTRPPYWHEVRENKELYPLNGGRK